MSEAHEAGAAPARAGWVRVALGALALAAVVVLARRAGHYVPALAQAVQELGFWGPLAFVVAYAVGVVGFVPGSLLTLAGGAIFGLAWGTLWVFVAAVLGSSGAFLVSRYLARAAVERRLGRSPRFERLDRAIGEEGLKILFLLRLSPAFPFTFLNYAMGLTSISFRDYVLASAGMLPGTLLYVYYGKLVGDVAALASGAAPEHGTGYYGVLGLGLVATIAVTAVVTRVARRSLQQQTQLEDGSG